MASSDPSLALPFDMSILTISHKRDRSSVKAVIVGGGISGLSIAIMMELAGMEFEILERSTGDEPPMGSSITLGPPVLRLMEQMGLLPQIERASKIVTGLTILDGECKRLGRVEGVDEDRYGYPFRMMTHGALHRILLDRVSKSHLHRGKLVVETLQNPNGASCKCSDGSTYYGDIIIGADGAQSLTRERMFKQLKDQGKLPDSDMEASCYEHLCIGGVSNPLDKQVFPTAHEATAEIQVIYTKEVPYTFWYLPVAGNRVAWGICQAMAPKYKYYSYSHTFPQVDPNQQAPEFLMTGSSRPFPAGTAQHRMQTMTPPISRSSSQSQSKILDDWFVPSTIDIDGQFKELMESRCALGVGTVGDFVANTPSKAISVLELEDRLYKTWYSGRIVLIGDAAHQHLIIGGQAAVQSMLDAVCLVNLLYDMEYNTPNELTKAFKKYHAKRSCIAKTSMDDTSQMDKIFHGQGFKAGIMRKFMFNTVWNFNMKNDKFNNNRPQLSFLQFVEDRGSSKASKQKISSRLSGNRSFSM